MMIRSYSGIQNTYKRASMTNNVMRRMGANSVRANSRGDYQSDLIAAFNAQTADTPVAPLVAAVAPDYYEDNGWRPTHAAFILGTYLAQNPDMTMDDVRRWAYLNHLDNWTPTVDRNDQTWLGYNGTANNADYTFAFLTKFPKFQLIQSLTDDWNNGLNVGALPAETSIAQPIPEPAPQPPAAQPPAMQPSAQPGLVQPGTGDMFANMSPVQKSVILGILGWLFA